MRIAKSISFTPSGRWRSKLGFFVVGFDSIPLSRLQGSRLVLELSGLLSSTGEVEEEGQRVQASVRLKGSIPWKGLVLGGLQGVRSARGLGQFLVLMQG